MAAFLAVVTLLSNDEQPGVGVWLISFEALPSQSSSNHSRKSRR